jgi:hypothetical protein
VAHVEASATGYTGRHRRRHYEYVLWSDSVVLRIPEVPPLDITDITDRLDPSIWKITAVTVIGLRAQSFPLAEGTIR